MKATLKIVLTLTIFCSVAFADGDMGTGGLTFEGDMGTGGKTCTQRCATGTGSGDSAETEGDMGTGGLAVIVAKYFAGLYK